jgi:hypothetical protein
VTHSKVHIGKHFSGTFPIQNASEYAIRNVQENQSGVKLNGTHQLLFYAHDVNLLGHNINTIKKNTQTLIDASKGVGLEVNSEKAKYMFLFRHQNAGEKS